MRQGKAIFKYFLFAKLLLAVTLFGIFNGLHAQEICDNSKDDDRDGLIDLKDPDCQCHWEATKNILLNPSFEEYKHCLTDGAYYSENYDIADNWQYGVLPNGDIAFYHNFSCPIDSLNYTDATFVQRPLPDGKAFIAMVRGSIRFLGYPENKSTKYYVAQCLQTPLIKDKNYTFSFFGGMFINQHTNREALDSFTVAVFGHGNCNAVPFGEINRGNGCPTNYDGWVMLGKTTVVSPFTWVQAKIDLSIPKDINVIEIGQDCSLPWIGDTSRGSTISYNSIYYLDNFQLSETKDFDFQYIQLQSGTACTGSYVLSAPVFNSAAYQWYKNGIALVEQKGNTYNVPDSSAQGTYNVRIIKNGDCKISEPLTLQLSKLSQLKFPADTFICKNDTLRLGEALPGVSYSWSGKQDKVVTIFEPGIYNVTASDTLGCTKNFIVRANFQECASCTVYMPNAFTPNGDGLNDVLRGHINCPIDEYQLKIFNRWGQKIFESNTLNEGWDGTFKGSKVPQGVYSYLIRFKNSSFEKNYKRKKGTVIVIR